MLPQACAPSALLTSFLYAALILLNLGLTTATPLLRHEIEDLFETTSDRLDKRQNSGGYTAVTGVRGFGTPPRLEIRQLQKNPDQWNLYLLGLNKFMNSDQTDKLSYYELCGIHGRPYIPWDNVGPFVNNTNGPGYCTHVSNIFLPWHRPYIALYEQVLYQHIIEIVNSFPSGQQRARYAQAAVSWRHPYWDWATPPTDGDSILPSSLTARTVNVTMPNGTNTIPNPLYAYNFHPVSVPDFYYNPFASWTETKRYPTSWNSDATSRDNLVAGALDNARPNIQQRLYNLFTNYDNFTEFSTEAWYVGNGPSNADSVESLHDLIHGITGQNGHMTYLDYSAFDPIFWLHHSMIDRLFALFQVLHPDSYVEPMSALSQTYTIQRNQVLDRNTPLDPFHKNAAGDKYTSDSARDIKSFGYSYPELTGSYSVSSVRAAINNLYGSSAGSKVLTSRAVSEDDEPALLDKRAATAAQLSAIPGETTPEGRRKQYMLNVRSEKFALNGSYAVYVFLGYFNEQDVSSWALAPSLVGTHAVFTSLTGQPADNGPQLAPVMPNVNVTGTIPLTTVLLEKVQDGELESMNDNHVGDYLTSNLHWRVAMFDNTEVPASKVAGLDVSLVRAEVMPASAHDDFPRWGNFVELKHLADSTTCAA